MKRFSLLLLTTLFIVSCSEKEIDYKNLVERNGLVYEVNSEKPFTGKTSKFNENGQCLLIGSYIDGLKTGEWTTYFENGQISNISTYLKGELNGLVKSYNKSGQLRNTSTFKEGLKHGMFESFYDNGNPKFKGICLDDKYDGQIEEWYSNGNKKIIANYSDTLLNGNYKKFDKSGFLKQDFNYKNGKQEGLNITYFEHSDYKHTAINYSNGIKNGLYEEWYSPDRKFKEVNFENNKIIDEKYWNIDGTTFPNLSSTISGTWFHNKESKRNVKYVFHEDGSCQYIFQYYNYNYHGSYTIKGRDIISLTFNMPSYMKNSNEIWEITYLTNKKMEFNIIEREGKNVRTKNYKMELSK